MHYANISDFYNVYINSIRDKIRSKKKMYVTLKVSISKEDEGKVSSNSKNR